MSAAFAALRTVRLEDGPFKRAQRLNENYLLGLDPQRLLAPFYREAGLPLEHGPYGNWESQGLDGHTAGHYLSATSMMFASTGDMRFRDRAEQIVEGLARAQDAGGTGYIGGVPDSAELWQSVASAGVDATTFTRNGRWVPLYNLHKTLAGLIEAHRSADIPDSLRLATGLADWWLALAAALSHDEFEIMLDTEFGGMNESFADLYALTGRQDYLDMAVRFSHRSILDPLAADRDELTGLHANTQIPKVLGYHRVSQLVDEPEFARAASFFYDRVQAHRTVSIGGHGVREHFSAPDDFRSMVEDREGPESCNSYNMLRLAAGLFEATGSTRYLDDIERILHNHVLSAQHPIHGGFVYFTPMRPRHYRVYSHPRESFWCCVGTGMEVHSRHGAYIFAEREDRLAVNLFIDSSIEWHGLRVTQRTTSAPSFETAITVHTPRTRREALDVRVPFWADGAPALAVNNEPFAATVDNGYLHVDREWADGDVLTVAFAASPRFEPLPDEPGWTSVAWGPVVYAARLDPLDKQELVADSGRMSHIAGGPLAPLAHTPIVTETDPRLSLTGTPEGTVLLESSAGTIVLEPFALVHDARYTAYFPTGSDADERRALLAARDAWQLGLDARTCDFLTFGEQQPESDHGLRADGSEHGHDGERTWRSTDSSMTAALGDWRRNATSIRLSWLDGDGDVAYDLIVNDLPVASIENRGADISPVVGSAEYALPSEVHDLDLDRLQVTVRAATGFRTHRLTEIRLLSD